MLYSIIGATFLIIALFIIVYKIYDLMIKEFIRLHNNNKEEE